VLNDRIKGTVLVIRRAAKLDTIGTLGTGLVFERLHQSGFADPRLTAEQHDLPCALLGLLPTLL
jgi:hypothetical protein